MHPKYDRANQLSRDVIGAGIDVHRALGPGLVESLYERCFLHELVLRGLPCTSQEAVRIRYKDLVFEETLRFDILVDDCLLVELKAVEKLLPIHKAQLLSYMKLMDIPLGLLMNFNSNKVTDGTHRLVLAGADS